jgi:CHAD domain-containing protein
VVRLQTRRRLTRLRDAEGRLLAEVADDHVTASVGEEVSVWREVEVELVHGDEDLLAAVGDALVVAGAEASARASKLARALRHRLPEAGPELPAGLGRRSAGAVVLTYVREQIEHLKEHDPKVRVDEEDAVHQMRVASRRLRSALATFRPLFDREVTDPVRDQLKWLGEELGAARDAEVVRDHLRQLVAAEPPELVLGPVERRIVLSLGARHKAAHDEALEQLGSERYFALLDSLDRLAADPPLTPLASSPARQVLPKLVRRTFRRVSRLVGEADAAETQEGRDLALHEVRKAAKRARYAGESVTAFFGADARTYAKRMSAVQTVLGDHQDSVVVREVLRELAVEAFAAGENAFTFGRLHALEQARGGYTEEDFVEAWSAASAKGVLRWLA